jgi:hypothetical protein
MNETKIEFDKRKIEIDAYFSLLSILDKGSCSVQCQGIDGNIVIESIDVELIKILKANGFLLLYNLVEATIRQSIVTIFGDIYRNRLTFQDLSDNLKRLWMNQETLILNKGIDAINSNRINEILHKVANSIIDNEIKLLEIECVRISGNIDAKEIRKIAERFGFEESENGRHLELIKDKRNHLAHGNFSFAEIGRDYTVQELIEFRDNAYEHLSDVITKIEEFLNEERFKNPNSSK